MFCGDCGGMLDSARYLTILWWCQKCKKESTSPVYSPREAKRYAAPASP